MSQQGVPAVTSSSIEALWTERHRQWEALCTCSCCRSSKDCSCGAADQILACRLCKSALTLRTSRAGELFWGCDNFSDSLCKYTERIVVVAAAAAPVVSATTTTGVSRRAAVDTVVRQENNNTREPRASNTTTMTARGDKISAPVAIVTDSLRSRESEEQQDPSPPAATNTKRQLFPSADDDVVAELSRSFIGPVGARHLAERCDASLLAHLQFHSRPQRRTSSYSYELPFSYLFRRPPQKKKIRRTIDHIPTVVDLFAGAGGMGLGFQQAGFDISCSVDHNAAAVATIQVNNKNEDDGLVLQDDVHDFLACVERREPEYYPTTTDHLNACPPCQDFSYANQRARTRSSDAKPRNALSLLLLDAVRLLQPTTVSFENVTGILSNDDNKAYLQQIVAGLLGMGYQVRAMILHARHFGVPQHRDRVIVLAAQGGFPLPKEPMAENDDSSLFTVEEALHDLACIDPVVDRDQPVLCNGGRHVYDHVEWRPAHRGGTRLNPDDVSETVLRQNTIKHYKHNRDLTMRERARLQSFPDSYRFCGTPKEQSDQIGNAVPVRVAAAIGRSVMESYRRFYGPSVAER